MLVKYTPAQLEVRDEIKEGEDPSLSDLFDGFIEIRLPSYPERLRFPKELGLDKLAGSGDEASELSKTLQNLEMLALCAEKVKPYVSSVSLKSKDGVELQSADDLYDYPAAGVLVAGLCTKFLSGFVEKKVSMN
jgi:hypothetical protein